MRISDWSSDVCSSDLPVLLLMVRVLTPGLPSTLQFPLPPTSANLDKYRRIKRVLDQLNPYKWMMRALYWLVLKLVSTSSAQDIIQTNVSPTFKRRLQFVNRNELQQSWQQLKAYELPNFVQLLGIIYHAQSMNEVLHVLWLMAWACGWKLKLALLVVCGVWTDEMAPQI